LKEQINNKEVDMNKSEVFSCEKCGEVFSQATLAEGHEKKCLPLEIGQRVKFLYGLVMCEGRITALHPPQLLGVGAKATVDLETDVPATDADFLHDGKHVWVERDNVLEVLSTI
jgi:hypothetical protein